MICPFATQKIVSYTGGVYDGAPFRIVLHTTEGATQAALTTFAKHYAPHFLVDAKSIYQFIDTDKASCALRNEDGGVETDRQSAIQIEMVGFAGQPKNLDMLKNTAKLCRWIEENYKVPKVWPNGPCKVAVKGNDGNVHNRDAKTWATQGGYYGHEHVPENIHWDPALTQSETKIILGET